MGFNSAFRGLNVYYVTLDTKNVTQMSCHKSMCILCSAVVAEYCDT